MQKLILLLVTLAIIASIEAQKYTHAQALAKIRAAGVSIASSGGCSDRNKASCTSLEQVRQKTIDNATGCSITITGGTEVGHGNGSGKSHYNGYKIDYRKNTCLDNYIKTRYVFIGKRGDGALQYKSAAGNIYALEGNHWDVTYF